MKYFLFSLFLLSILHSCVPFDSNDYNKKMIQSTWIQVELEYFAEDGDSIIVEEAEGHTVLAFTVDSCHEQLLDLNTTAQYSYDIKDYVLKLEKDAENINYFEIEKLTSDSLILSSAYFVRKYIKRAD